MTTAPLRVQTPTDLLGAPPAPKTGRDRLVHVTIDLCYAHGFNAVGLDRILDAAGVTKTTFYKHFDSKEDLVVAAVKARDEWETRAWERAIKKAAGDDPRAQLLALFDLFDTWFNDPTFGGCMFINTAAEFPDPRDPVHQIAAEHKRKARDGWEALAKRAGAKDAGTFADLYATVVEGTLIMRHVHGRNEAAKLARPMVEKLIVDYLPA
jgi:AcrR family transcriptional regulator